ncbi:hypothetical protein [Agromyces sp. SYSU T00266]|uniref:hypothetical protein n=1 Tax=Agromyces zhanjiangensis TaxID=3158562 RepID=UPI00339B3270
MSRVSPLRRWRAHPYAVVVPSLVVIAVTYLAVAGFAIATLPWEGTADAYDHLDYMVQLASGQLPQPFGHVFAPTGTSFGANRVEGRQYASAHPPLFYALAVAVAGPLLDVEHWRIGVAIVRTLNVLVGLAGVGVLSWAGWTIGGRRRVALAIALPAVGAFTFGYLRFSAEIYNDLLVTVLSMTAIAIACRMLVSRVTWPWLIALVAVCALGMGAKATFILTLGLCTVAVATAILMGTGLRRGSGYLRAVGAAVLVFVVPFAVWGWFYLRNLALSGDWYRSTPKSPVGTRSNRTLLSNLLDPDFYTIVPRGLVGRGSAEMAHLATQASVVIFTFGAAVSLVAAVIVLVRRRWRLELRTWAIIGLLAAHLLGSYALQLSHSTGYGAYNWRYFLPATITIAIILAGGIAVAGRAAAVLVPVMTAALAATNMTSFVEYGSTIWPKRGPSDDLVIAAAQLIGANGLPPWLLVVFIATAVGGIVALGFTFSAALQRESETTGSIGSDGSGDAGAPAPSVPDGAKAASSA